MDILSLILGAILGVVLEKLFSFVMEKTTTYSHTRKAERRQSLLESKRVHDWLIAYYQNRGSLNNLFECKIGSYEVKIPFLTKKEWLFVQPVDADEDVVVQFAKSQEQENEFKINQKLIDERKKMGQNLFNEPHLYLDHIDSDRSSTKIYVKACQYYQSATNLIGLEEETFRAIQNKVFKNTPIRDRYLSSLDSAQKVPIKPFPVGCPVTFAIRTPNGYELLIHTRSRSTITFGGTKATIPNFGLMPIMGQWEGYKICVLFYNFVKEYLEELFNYNELSHIADVQRVYPKWFYELPEAKDLLLSKSFSLECLGLGFNALNGVTIVAMLARIDDTRLSNLIKEKINANWEVAKRTTESPSIEFVDYKSPKLETWLLEMKYSTASAFSISRAIERLTEL